MKPFIPYCAACSPFASLIALLLLSCGGGGITIAKKGESPYAIVISTRASLSEKHAAGELRNFIRMATDADVPIVDENDSRAGKAPRIFVGAGPALEALKSGVETKFSNEEAFAIKTVKTGGVYDFIISGNPRRGTMYGVYTFLDRLGFRWYTKRITRFPGGKTLRTEPLDFRDEPAFMSRDTTIKEAHDPDWAARNRMNAGHADLDSTRGGKIGINSVHTLDRLVPPELFNTHPEYFPLIGGRRVTGLVQRCMSNPEIVDIAVKNLEKWMDEEPDQRIFSVSANDVDMLCECDTCRRITEEEGATSGLFLRFVNQVAERIQKTRPEKYVCTLAYAITEKAPKITSPRENVIIQLCPFGVCCGHSFTKCDSKASVEFYKTLQDWGKICHNIFIWHYATNFDAYLLPFPNFKEFTRDIKVYRENGVNGLFFQGAGDAGSSDGELRIWVAARLMWNPDLAPDSLIDEWMHGVYGKAYAPMRNIFDHIQSRVADPEKHLSLHGRIRKDDWPDAELSLLDSLYSSAENLARGDGDALYAIRKNRMSIRYLNLLFNSGRLALDGDRYRPEGNAVTYADYERYRRDMDAYGIEALREEPFDCIYADLLGEKLSEHRSVFLENADMRVVVVPDLGGRIVSIIRKDTGEDILGKTDPLNYFYPAYGGYEESTTMTWGRTGFSNKYRAEVTGRGMTLTAPEGISSRSKGLIFRRTMTIPPRGMKIDFESAITNISGGMKYARLISRMEIGGDPAQSVLFYRNSAGKTIEMDAKNLSLRGADAPNGVWGVRNKVAGWSVVNRFPPREVESCDLNCSSGAKTVAMETLGFEKNLAPGAKITRKHSYEITESITP